MVRSTNYELIVKKDEESLSGVNLEQWALSKNPSGKFRTYTLLAASESENTYLLWGGYPPLVLQTVKDFLAFEEGKQFTIKALTNKEATKARLESPLVPKQKKQNKTSSSTTTNKRKSIEARLDGLESLVRQTNKTQEFCLDYLCFNNGICPLCFGSGFDSLKSDDKKQKKNNNK